jgi:tetratricopeptide (TPR) repeat protein
MFTDNQDNKYANIQPGRDPYFDLMATLHIFIAGKKWDSLEQSSRNMISIYPESEFGWFALGLAMAKKEDYNGAILNFKKALYLNPNIISAIYQLGIIYYKQKDYYRAIRYYEDSESKGMNSHFLYYNWGNAWLKNGNTKKAITYYLRCLSICPDFTPAAYALFNIYFGKHDYLNAVSSLKPLISDNNLPNYLLAQAKLLYADENDTNYVKLRKALKLLNGAIDLDENFALAYYERAYVKAKLGDVAGFSNDKSMAFQLNPELKKGHSFSLFSSYYI